MLTFCPNREGITMRGKEPAARTTAFAQWLTDNRQRRGLTMTELAIKMGFTSHARVSQVEKGDEPTPDFVKRAAAALSPEGADEEYAVSLYREGMRLAFDLSDYDEDEDIAYLLGQPPDARRRALRILKAAFGEEDAADNAGNIGRRAE